MKAVSGKEVIKALCKNGFALIRQRGSHAHLIKRVGEREFHVTVPVHANKDLNPFVIRSIARQAGYGIDEFRKFF
ncbi:MAG: type II toxin-antitoxin system HicA family toxin [Candidatus Micrarchaeota archaeon]